MSINTAHGILQARILEWVAFPFSRGSSQPGIEPWSPHGRWILYQLRHKGSPRILEWVAYPFSSTSSQLRNRTKVFCIAGRLFTNLAIREALRAIQMIYLLLVAQWLKLSALTATAHVQSLVV